MLSTQFVLLRPVRTLSPFPLSPFLSLSPVLSHSHSLLLQHLPPIISQTFAPRLLCGGDEVAVTAAADIMHVKEG